VSWSWAAGRVRIGGSSPSPSSKLRPRSRLGGADERPSEGVSEHAAERDHRGPERQISQELLARDLTRLAYVARDGTPRCVPIGFVWNGSELVMCTAKNAAKLPALRHNPAVALTIDTEVHPPKILLMRGRAELDVVEGIPDEYLQMNGSYTMTPEQRVEWEAEVRSLYDGMVRIVVTSTWAKLIDFETTLPSTVAELARQREERQRT
jgi:Pyridoxamine 5'-phosphate oxidase